MDDRARHAHGKLRHAVSVLATDRGDVRSRLGEAFRSTRGVLSSYFPENLTAEYERIQATLTARAPTESEARAGCGSLEVTLAQMGNITGERVAEWLVALEVRMREYTAGSSR